MDLSKLKELQNNAQAEIDEANSRNNNKEGYKLLYPSENGSFRIKLIFNEKSGLLQRKLIRHTIGKSKLPCLSIYGDECPICQEIRNAEEIDKECGAFHKYGYKVRGVAYGVLMNHDKGLFNGNNDPKDGEVVLFMYPISLYNKINEVIVKAGDFIEDLVGKNDGKVFEITRSQTGNGPIDYSATVYAYGNMKVRETDEEFEKLINEIPSLSDTIIPSNLTEDDLQKVKSAAETIRAEYVSGKVINPNNPDSIKEDNNENNGQSLADAMNPPVEESSDGKPDCYGKHSEDAKCLACPYEADCIIA